MLKYFRFRKDPASTINILSFSIILCWLGWAVFYSLAASINIPTFHLDGAFQTASGLYRLVAGQFPGKDFYPYLGIGPLFVLYPFFKALGANISASVFSAQFVVLFIGGLSTAFIWHLIWRPKSFIPSFAAGCILFLAPIGVSIYLSLPLPHWMMFSASPGNSLRPIRAAAPYLVAMAYYFFIPYIGTVRKKYTFAGLLTGSILLWSNDFAIPSAGLLAFFIFANALRCKEFQIRNVLVYLIATVLSWMTLLTLMTHGHPVELLKYNFLDVAQDQWWFFGPYGETKRIFSLQQLPRLFSQENDIPLFVLALIAILALKTRLIEHALLLWIGAVLFAGGVVASVGGHLGGYFGGFYFWGMMAICVGFSRLVWLGFRRISERKSQITIISALILLGVSMFLMIHSLNNLSSGLSGAKNDPNRFFVPELGGYLNKEWKDYINLARKTNANQVFEEYWGLWSATRKVFPTWPVDSVIHALGSTRLVAAKNLQSADTIISTRYSTSPAWQPWNLSQNYWFYEYLLKNWTPLYLSPATIVWQKSESTRPSKSIDCHFDHKGIPLLMLNAQDSGFYEIEMEYNFSGTGRALIMVRNNLSFGADAGGYVSIDPKARRVKFPVYIPKAGVAPLDIKFIGTSYNNFQINSCSAQKISLVDGEVLHIVNVGDSNKWMGCDLPTIIGKYTSNCETENTDKSNSGNLSFGPYVALSSGKYFFEVEYVSSRGKSEIAGDWDVVIAYPDKPYPLAKGVLMGTENKVGKLEAFFTFKSAYNIEQIEVRTFAHKGGSMRIDYLKIKRLE